MTEKKPGKQPEDKKAPDTGPSYEEIEVTVGEGENERVIPARRTTLRGLTLTVEERALSDYRVTRAIAKARRGDALANIDVLDIVLGEAQHDQVAELFTDTDGFVDGNEVGEFVTELFRSLAPN